MVGLHSNGWVTHSLMVAHAWKALRCIHPSLRVLWPPSGMRSGLGSSHPTNSLRYPLSCVNQELRDRPGGQGEASHTHTSTHTYIHTPARLHGFLGTKWQGIRKEKENITIKHVFSFIGYLAENVSFLSLTSIH